MVIDRIIRGKISDDFGKRSWLRAGSDSVTMSTGLLASMVAVVDLTVYLINVSVRSPLRTFSNYQMPLLAFRNVSAMTVVVNLRD